MNGFRAFILLLLVFVAGLSRAEVAYDQGYIGVDVIQFDLEVDPIRQEDIKVVTLGLRGGYLFTPYIGVEGRYGTGITEEQNLFGIGLDVSVDYYLSGLGVLRMPLGKYFSVYAVGGYTQAKASANIADAVSSEDESGYTVGAGATLKIHRRGTIGLEYLQLLDENSIKVAGLGLNTLVWF